MLSDARRIVAAANKTDRKKRKALARRDLLHPEERYELLTSPVNSKGKRQVSELEEDTEGGAGAALSDGEREMSEGYESEGSRASEEREFHGIGAGNSTAQSPTNNLLDTRHEAVLSADTEGEPNGSEARQDHDEDDPGDSPSPPPSPPKYRRSPTPDYEHEYMSDEDEEAIQTDKQKASLLTKFDEDHAAEAQRKIEKEGAFAAAAAGNPSVEQDFFQRPTDLEKASERMRKNAQSHDDRIQAIVNSGYNLHETLHALKITRDLVGMESTERAAEYLRKNSKTPIQRLTAELSTVQQKMSGLQKESVRFSQTDLESFGPALSDLAEEHPRCAKQAVYVKRLHDMQPLKHLSSCAKAAEALRRQMAASSTIHAEYRDPEFLGRICVAVVKDCEKCTANRAKCEAKEADALKAVAEIGVRRQREEKRTYSLEDRPTDRSKPRSWCRVCSRGCRIDIPDGENLNFCDCCDRGTHEHCETLAEYEDAKGLSFYICYVCEQQQQVAADLTRVDPNSPPLPKHASVVRNRRRELQPPQPRNPASRMICRPAMARAERGEADLVDVVAGCDERKHEHNHDEGLASPLRCSQLVD
jgi:hypothetical protein